MSDWDAIEARFAPAMKSAGMTTRARVKSGGALTDVDLTRFDRPDVHRFDGAVMNRDYTIEYQHDDLPRLKEGDTVFMLDADDELLDGEKYKVREVPTITDNPADSRTGFFRIALLERVKAA